MDKLFFWKDKSGGGRTNTFTTISGLIKAFTGEKSWDDESIRTWVQTAEVGDKWENAANEVTRIE